MANKIVIIHVYFFENKTRVYQEKGSINFLKSGVTPRAGLKTSEAGAELEYKIPDYAHHW